MQLGENLYVDIEVDGLDKKNLIQFLDLIDLKIIETAGASLPILYLAFVTMDEKVKNYVQQNNSVKVTIGNNQKDADTFLVHVDYPGDMVRDHFGGWLVEFAGFTANSAYMVEQMSKVYQGNSLLVVNQVMKDYFGVKGDKEHIEPGEIAESLSDRIKEKLKKEEKEKKYYIISDFKKTSEEQVNWRRTNETACSFVLNTLLHCDVRPSFPLFTFDKYGRFYIKDLKKAIKEGPICSFTSSPITKKDQIQYVNDFSVESYKSAYNMYSGYNKITEIQSTKSGLIESLVSKNDPILATSSVSEKAESGSIVQMNAIQSTNVHKTYQACFEHNTNKGVALSSMVGKIILADKYYKQLKPLDLVSIATSDLNDATIGGMYLIDTIITEADPASGGIRTQVFLTRDNKNNVENYVVKRKKLRIRDKFFKELSRAVGALSNAYAMCLKFIDGTYLAQTLSFLVATRTNLLRAFSIAGVAQDFTGQRGILKSLIYSGNSLMNVLLDTIFPEDIASTLRDFIIRKPSLIGLIGNYVAEWVPFKARFPIMYLIQSLFDVTDTLNKIATDNGITTTDTESKEEIKIVDTSERDYIEESRDKIGYIIQDFENNTTGLDIPFPIIPLTESQAVFPDDDLRNYVATEAIDNLIDLGYMEGVDKDEFKQILLGEKPINFSLIDKINKNAGNSFSYRLWGTFNQPLELTDFYIKKSFKDKFRTLPCTKLIAALNNAKIFFACPKKEEDLRFYINSNRVLLESFDIDLGYTDALKEPMKYTVYYTTEGYNSNSVLFEVKQGGMV